MFSLELDELDKNKNFKEKEYCKTEEVCKTSRIYQKQSNLI